MTSFSRDATALLANSLLFELSWVLDDDDPRQGVLHRGSLKVVAAVLIDLLDSHDVPHLDEIRRAADESLVLAAAQRAGLLDTDEQIAAAGRLARANSLLLVCEARGLAWEDLSAAVVSELDRQLGAFYEGRRDVPLR